MENRQYESALNEEELKNVTGGGAIYNAEGGPDIMARKPSIITPRGNHEFNYPPNLGVAGISGGDGIENEKIRGAI